MKNRNIIFIALIIVVFSAFIISIEYNNTNVETVASNWNYQQLTLFNHSLNNFIFTYSGDERDDNGNFSKMINNINSNYPNIQFNINGGDLRSDSSQINSFKRDYLTPGSVAIFNKPVMFVIGNHEIINNENESIYQNTFGSPSYYNFTENNTYFIIIDNANSESLNNTQMNWLKEQLAISQEYKYRFVFMHVPLYVPNGETEHGMENTGDGGADALKSLFDSYNITMIFASHIHNYYNGTWGKTPYIISGGAGAPPEDNHQPNHHYIVINVTSGSVSYTTIKY
jgi:serine/threonine-protein phosphatase CPPED1